MERVDRRQEERERWQHAVFCSDIKDRPNIGEVRNSYADLKAYVMSQGYICRKIRLERFYYTSGDKFMTRVRIFAEKLE